MAMIKSRGNTYKPGIKQHGQSRSASSMVEATVVFTLLLPFAVETTAGDDLKVDHLPTVTFRGAYSGFHHQLVGPSVTRNLAPF